MVFIYAGACRAIGSACLPGGSATPPDPSGLTAYTRLLTQSGDLGQVITSLIHSEEFWKKTIALRATALVEAIYQGLFSRKPEPEVVFRKFCKKGKTMACGV